MDEIIVALAASERPIEQLTLDDVARLAGISRATLLRRIGSRARLEAAAIEAGLTVTPVASVRERAVVAAADLVAERGLNRLTFDAVAERAECSTAAIFRVFADREGLLRAMFERFTPVERLTQALQSPPPDLAGVIHALYRAHVDSWGKRPALIRALLADLAANPDGAVRHYVAQMLPARTLPILMQVWARSIAAGESRLLPLPIWVQILAAPLMAHLATRDIIERFMPMPDWDQTIDLLVEAACRAVAPTNAGHAAPDPPSADLPAMIAQFAKFSVADRRDPT